MYMGLSLTLEGAVFHSIGQNRSSVAWSVDFFIL